MCAQSLLKSLHLAKVIMTKTPGYDVMSTCHNKDILNNVIFAFKMPLLSESHLMTVVINPTSYSRHRSCHGYEGVMSVL